jgi:subtilisin family serine protease
MSFLRFRTRAGLEKVLRLGEVKAAYENRPIYPLLAYSLPFIRQPAVASRGLTGIGVTVAVIDTGINYTLAEFGSCTAPGVPAGCKVNASVDVTGHGVTLNTDPLGHGTNVAGIAAGVAPGARIASVNAFFHGTSTVNWIISGINWVIANKAAYSITAMNMSLGDGGNYSQPCADSATDPFVVPVGNARSAGVLPVAASGNSGFSGGISSPACVPGVVSVGAVYDANWGGPYTWNSGCTDVSTGPDRIPCFSDSASFLTLLAPGAFVTAAGVQMAGTSQASPHVAGSVAVLRSAFPADTLDQTVSRMAVGGVPITDPRNGVTTPRLDLSASVGPPAVAVPALSPRGMGPAAGLLLVFLSTALRTGKHRRERDHR